MSVMADGYTPYTPGVNCLHCGRFVGRDGYLYYEYCEMSNTIASLDGECRRCIDAPPMFKAIRGSEGAA